MFTVYTKLEDRISQPKPAFFPIDSHNLLKNVPVIEITPKTDKNSDWFDQQDIDRIQESSLDVIVQRGFRILKGGILKTAKYGVWSYRPDGGSPGFRETFERKGEREVILQILTEDPDNGIVLYRSFFDCASFFVGRNNNHCFLRSSLFVPRTLQRLYNEGEKAFFDRIEKENKKINFNTYAVSDAPENPEFLALVIKHAYHTGAFYYSHIFFRNQWFLMYDLNDGISTSFRAFQKNNSSIRQVLGRPPGFF